MQARFLPISALLAVFIVSTPSGAEPVALDLPAGLPESLELELERDGEPVLLQLERRSLRAKNFRVRAWTRNGGYREVEPPPVSTYLGTVAGEPDSVVGASIQSGGLHATVFPAGGEPWSIRPTGAGGHEIFSDLLAEAPDAGGVQVPEGAIELPDDAPARPKMHDCDLYLAEIAFDVDNPYHVGIGGVLADTLANVEGHLAVVDAHYARDAQITYALTEIIVREDPFYLPDADNNLLVLFRDEWRANQQMVQRDIAHLMTGQPAPGLAGLAYVSVTCSQAWAYGWSVNSSGVVSHEIGHNWSSGHCHDTAPCNNMCGACLYIGPNTKDIITRFRDSRDCLDVVGGFAEPLPPYASPDRLTVTRDELVNRSELPVDVLANDHDGNCDELRLESFDATSLRGGLVSRSAGTGAFGHDELLYTPPCAVFVGEDRFEYRLADATGEVVTGTVTVDLLDLTLAAWWPLDEGAGDTAAELARGGSAALAGTPAWDAGPRDGALLFDGVDDFATTGALNLPRTSSTFTAWIRPDGVQVPWAGIIFTREAGTTAGLNFADNGSELRYHWQGGSWDWSSGISLTPGAWSFIALVVEPEQATLWVDDGTGLVSSVHAVPHGLQTWAGAGRLGEDPTGGRLFRGALDDVRVFDHALGREQLEALVATGGENVAPSPADGSLTREARPLLSWIAPSDADEHDIYFGEDFVAVRDATPADPVYRGRTTATDWIVPDLLLPGRSYAWRVDVVRGGVPTPGPVWIFESDSASPRLHAHWTFDEGGGTTVGEFAGRGFDGDLLNGAGWAPGRFDGALQLDGVDDAVDLPDLDFPELPLTISLWMRRNGPQMAWAGLLFARGTSDTGFNFGDGGELRYHWGNGAASWGWNSGIVPPDDAWVLVALTVESDRATIWMHDGTLVSAVRSAAQVGRPFDGDVRIGQDPIGWPRYFGGLIDDLRVWSGVLGEAELEDLWQVGGRATNPIPADGVELDASPPVLEWTPRPDATAHELYYGDSLDAVLAAGPGDPEHLGTLAVTRLPLPQALGAGERRYWRVDELTPGGTVAGEAWRFALVERVGDSLRVRKTGAELPELRWSDPGRGREYEILRCEPARDLPCDPAGVDVVGPYRADWTDPDAGGRSLVWYRVVETGACAP